MNVQIRRPGVPRQLSHPPRQLLLLVYRDGLVREEHDAPVADERGKVFNELVARQERGELGGFGGETRPDVGGLIVVGESA